MDSKEIMKIYTLLLVISNSYFVSAIQCYICLYNEGNPDPAFTDQRCKTLEGGVYIGRSAETQDEKVEKTAGELLAVQPASSGRQDAAICLTFVGTWDGKDTVLRSNGTEGSPECSKLDQYINFRGFGRKYVIGEVCICDTEVCNNKPVRGTGGGGGGVGYPPAQGSLVGRNRDQKFGFIAATLQALYIMLVGNNR